MDKLKLLGTALQQLEYSINFNEKIIYLEGDIDTFSAPFLLERVQAIRDYYKELYNDPSFEPEINLFITSPGGDVNGLTAIVDIIEALPCKINTYGFGYVESAAVWILAAGSGKRRVSANTEVMVHEMSSWLKGTTSDVENEAKQLVSLQKNLYRLLEKFTKRDENFWEQTLKNNKNFYLTPEMCVEYGLADEIVTTNSL